VRSAPNFIQYTDNLITLGNTSAKNKGRECTIAYNNIESRFPDHVFYINFDISMHCIRRLKKEIIGLSYFFLLIKKSTFLIYLKRLVTY